MGIEGIGIVAIQPIDQWKVLFESKFRQGISCAIGSVIYISGKPLCFRSVSAKIIHLRRYERAGIIGRNLLNVVCAAVFKIIVSPLGRITRGAIAQVRLLIAKDPYACVSGIKITVIDCIDGTARKIDTVTQRIEITMCD